MPSHTAIVGEVRRRRNSSSGFDGPVSPLPRTRICSPASSMGCEKSNWRSRSAVMEIAEMPRSALPERTSSSSAPTSGATSYAVATFNFCAMLFQSSMLKPVRRLCSSITIGGSTRVATRTLRGGTSASDAGTANASSSPLMQSLTMWRMRSPDPAVRF